MSESAQKYTFWQTEWPATCLIFDKIAQAEVFCHIDDESIVCSLGRQYGYNAYQLEAEDEEWKEKIIERAEEIKHREMKKL